MNKQVIICDKWNNKFIYDCVYKCKLQKNKLFIYSKANNKKSLFVFNLTYTSKYSIKNYAEEQSSKNAEINF